MLAKISTACKAVKRRNLVENVPVGSGYLLALGCFLGVSEISRTGAGTPKSLQAPTLLSVDGTGESRTHGLVCSRYGKKLG